MNLQFLISQPELRERVCAGLTFEDGIAFKEYLNLPSLDCSFSIEERDHLITSLSRVDDQTIRIYRFMQRNGSKRIAIAAVNDNQLDLLKLLIENGLPLDLTLSPHYSLVSYIAQKDRPEMLEYLLNSGSNPRSQTAFGFNLLSWAVWKNHFQLVKLIVEKIKETQPDFLIEDLTSATISAATKKSPEILSYLVEQGAQLQPTLVNRAADNGSLPVVKFLVERGVDIHAKHTNMTPLEVAIWKEHTDVVRYLLEHGANPNDASGFPVLHNAIQEKKSDIVKLLLDFGANPNIEYNYGMTPLKTALSTNQPIVVKYLLEAGANPNEKDNKGKTILMEALSFKNIENIRLLLEHGADPNVSYSELGLTPMWFAGTPELQALLTQYGAK